MSLFGHRSGPHLAHFHAKHGDHWAVLRWELRNSEPLRWRILRSDSEFAETAEAGDGQALVYEGTATEFQDADLTPDAPYFYSVFCQNGDGHWRSTVEVRVTPKSEHHWERHEAMDEDDPAYLRAMDRLRLGLFEAGPRGGF